MGFLGYLLAAVFGLLVGYLLGARKKVSFADDEADSSHGDDQRARAGDIEATSAAQRDGGQDDSDHVVNEHAFARLQADYLELQNEAEAEMSLAAEENAKRDERIAALEAELAEAQKKAEQVEAASKRSQQAKQKDRMSSVRRRMVTRHPGASSPGPSSKEEATIQQKYERAQKYLVTARKERDTARAEVRELKEKLASRGVESKVSADEDQPAPRPRVPRRERKGAQGSMQAAAAASEPAPAKAEREAAEPSPTESTSTEESVNGARGWLLTEPQGDVDDLKKIKGIGPVMCKSLNDLGVWHFRQLATLSSGDLDWLAEQVGMKRARMDKADWSGQAAKLHEKKYGAPLS